MEERVEFPNLSKTHTLRGTLIRSRDDSSIKVAVLCHGLNCDRNSSFLPALSSHLSEFGWSSLRFDFSGSGESGGNWSYANYTGEAEDLESAIKFLFSIDLEPVVAIGHSKAATVILIHAAKFNSVQKYVYVSGRLHIQANPAGRFSSDDLQTLR